MMNNLIYLFDTILTTQPGLQKKAFMQMKSFYECGYSPYLISQEGCFIKTFDYINKKYSYIFYANKMDYYQKIFDFMMNLNPKIVYIRKKTPLDYFVMNFYKKCSEGLSNVQLVLEIPTYPYNGEFGKATSSGSMEGKYLEIDAYYRSFLSRYFRYSTNFHGYDTIFNIPSLTMYNGVDFELLKQKKNKDRDNKSIHLVSVTSMGFWNGYERLLAGLRNYYQGDKKAEIKVYFHLVGDGVELLFYKELAEKYDLTDYVLFYGMKTGVALDNIIDQCDIGVLTLGLYKVQDTMVSSSIRLCEYGARGLPILYAGELLAKEYPYKLEFENNNTDLDINEVVDFYKDLLKSPTHSDEIRDYAKKHFEWKIHIKNLLRIVCSTSAR